jgi:circadian clock protein KaiB
MTFAEHTRAPARDEDGSVARPAEYAFTLFVSGASESSARAIEHIREICDGHLPGCHDLRVVDLHQQPALAGRYHVLATPTLIRDRPLPSRIVVGDMSDHRRILAALEVTARWPGAELPDHGGAP